MNTPAHGIELPRFRPSQPEEPFTVDRFVERVEAFAAYLRERTTPKPTGAPMATRAPVTTEEDPEFESGTRPIGGRESLASMDDDTLVSAGSR